MKRASLLLAVAVLVASHTALAGTIRYRLNGVESGDITVSDVAAFSASYETGDSCADVDDDGSVNGGDLGAFFTLFEAGGC